MASPRRVQASNCAQRLFEDRCRSIVATTLSSSAILRNVSGASMPSVGWFQRASASTPAISQRLRVELRLVVGDELVALEPAQDLVGDALGAHDLGLQRLGEELVAVAAAALGAIERDVGIDQQPLADRPRRRAPRDADADAEAALVPLVGHRLAHVLR